MGILETHLHHCVREALEKGDQETIRAQLDEVLRSLARIE
jgi:DNA-binding FrmR family transcriptional regulator